MTKEEIIEQLNKGFNNIMSYGVDAYVINEDTHSFRAATEAEIEELLNNPTLEVIKKTVSFKEIQKQFSDVLSQEECDALTRPTLVIPNNVEWDADKWLDYSKSQPLIKEFPAHLSNIKWSVDLAKADEHDITGLSLIEVDSNNVLLSMNLRDIPDGWSIEDFLKYIQEEGIAIVNKSKED